MLVEKYLLDDLIYDEFENVIDEDYYDDYSDYYTNEYADQLELPTFFEIERIKNDYSDYTINK